MVATNQEKPKPETKKEEGRALRGTRAYIWIGPNGLFVQSNLERCGSSSKRTLAFSQMRIPSGLWTVLLTSPNSCWGSTVRVTTSQSGLKTHLRTQGRDGAPGGCSKEELIKRDTHTQAGLVFVRLVPVLGRRSASQCCVVHAHLPKNLAFVSCVKSRYPIRWDRTTVIQLAFTSFTVDQRGK